MLCTAILWYLPPTLWLELEVNIFCPSFEKITKVNTDYFVLTYLFSSASATKFLPLITHFGDSKITFIFDRKKVSLQFSRKKGWNWCCKFLTFFKLIFGDNQITSIFAQKKVSLQFSPKYRDVLCTANLCYSFTYFGDNAITSIFAKGWGSLAFSKMMVKNVAKIG